MDQFANAFGNMGLGADQVEFDEIRRFFLDGYPPFPLTANFVNNALRVNPYGIEVNDSGRITNADTLLVSIGGMPNVTLRNAIMNNAPEYNALLAPPAQGGGRSKRYRRRATRKSSRKRSTRTRRNGRRRSRRYAK